ncbi:MULTISPECIES: plasmid partitioning protein RepB [unclassified Rhizobium]|uniref:plasmid partitioning protein RepB n=1 Tax=unclassified Rhizobium TaxID=2613769 RepID=UPI001ADB991E|nr:MULTISPECIES: plasmid partitioning protein RepB [unclassified Rhizobium]MBO9127434.1 plasmid partitioning protein RepB [Rhizobium sp. 16-488-2b]MBO9177877.1 plasmid partitioning protein RepB [Rhizobium sp. 16-488-2a]
MSKSPRKSIVASFGLLSAELESGKTTDISQDPGPAPSPATGNRVGAGVIGAAHRAIDDIRTERDRLKALVESGGATVRDVDPSLIDPSPYPDRLPDDDAASFDAFKRSLEVDGQKVPIQIRKHPSDAGRFQIVYGHRRWRAAKELNKSVKAVEVDMSDLDLVVAQGIENASRQDLTWIERALFASRMDDAGIKAREIYAALSIEAAELARMRSVYRAVPADIIEAIGRAPKVGRPRWLDLAKLISAEPAALDIARETLALKADPAEFSDQRFQRVLVSLKPSAEPRPAPTPIVDSNGARHGTCVVTPKEIRLVAENGRERDFLKFIGAELPALVERFAALRHEKL